MESEFGRGLVVCLIKWAAHLDKYFEMKERLEEIGYNLRHLGCFWIAGASDHLYDIKVPDGKDWDEIRNKVQLLYDEAFIWRYSGIDDKFNDDKFKELYDLTCDIALLIDKKLGIDDADIGVW